MQEGCVSSLRSFDTVILRTGRLVKESCLEIPTVVIVHINTFLLDLYIATKHLAYTAWHVNNISTKLLL